MAKKWIAEATAHHKGALRKELGAKRASLSQRKNWKRQQKKEAQSVKGRASLKLSRKCTRVNR